MASEKQQMEKRVLQAVREASHLPLQGVIKAVSGDKETVSRAIRTLIDTGKLQLTLDWELREKDQNPGVSRGKGKRKG